MLNIANVDENLKTYIKGELLVDDFFELMSLVTENIYQGQSNQQVLQLDTQTIRVKNGNLILLRRNENTIMNFAEIRNFCKEIVFETIFAVGENCERITAFLQFLDDTARCTNVMDIENYCDEESGVDNHAVAGAYMDRYAVPAKERNMQPMAAEPSGDETGVLDPAYLQKALHSNPSSRLYEPAQEQTQRCLQLDNTKSGSITDIDKDLFWIGKGADCDLRILDETVSRKHASIMCKNNHYFLCDNGSTNKTFVNNKEIPPKASVEIFDGARIKFSNVEFSFRIEQ